MRAHILQHIWFEDSGTISQILCEKGFTITSTRFDLNEKLPNDYETIDFLIIMGGFMSANDEEEFAWLKEEKRFIKMMIDSGAIVLGICLGAQLIASALGAKVYKNKEKEIGWHEVTSVIENEFIPHSFPAFCWHGETFDLPEGALLLASSAACKHQAFLYARRVLALQFHLETTERNANLLAENCGGELTGGRYVFTKERIQNAPSRYYQRLRSIMHNVISALSKGLE
ncbi:MAG: type 1 glutamine amidotransferase [Helicobacteraceae bacterium]|jgi:GMP synthase-like glutamine amidotransferase|nr:type 1 glutamine amidotransferase [Helicobacteraceae bacterium]